MDVPLSLAITWQPIAAPLNIAGGAGILVVLAIFAYVRVFQDHPRSSILLLLMRLAVIAVVSVLLLGPSREIPLSPGSDRPQLTILVDTSESMLTQDCETGSRIGFVAERILPLEQMKQLEEEFDIDLQGFDEKVLPLRMTELHRSPDAVASGKTTLLADSVTSTLSRLTSLDDGHLMLVVSDGRDTEDAPVHTPASIAASKGVPVYTIGVGGTQSAVDAALLAIPMQDSLLPGEPGGILVKVYQSGLEGASSVVKLVSGDQTQRVPIQFTDDQVAEIQLTVERDEPGQYEFDISLEAVEGENELTNNSQTVFLEVMKRRIRVLLVEGQPFWDSKFLAQSLRKDEQIELTQITQVGDFKQETIVTRAEGTSQDLPETLEEWAEYDVVILGRNIERILDEDAAPGLAQFISESGGNVVFARGPAWDSSTTVGGILDETLSVLEPVTWGENTLESLSLSLTPSGRTAAWFATTKMGIDADSAVQRLPGFELMPTIEKEKAGAIVLARAYGSGGPNEDGLPAITRMQYGRGQVVSILGEGLWKWSLLPPDLQDLRGFYDTFWSNLIRWMALGGDFPPGQQVSLQLSRTSARLGDEMTVDVVYKQPPLSGGPPQLEITGPDGQPLSVTLNKLPGQIPRYRATLTPDETGVHVVSVNAPGMSPSQLERKFNVYQVNLERLQTSANFLALQMLAEHSGGAMFDAVEVGSLLDELNRHRQAMMIPPQMEYIWDQGWLMSILLIWAGVEWLIRRMAGLW